jgi:hypothetical protein
LFFSLFDSCLYSDTLLEEANDDNEKRDRLGVANAQDNLQRVMSAWITRRQTDKVSRRRGFLFFSLFDSWLLNVTFLEEAIDDNEERDRLGVTNAPDNLQRVSARISRRRSDKVGGVVSWSSLSRRGR